MNDKWVKRWAVRSSLGDGDYIIGKDTDGNYGCSCRGWTMNVVKMCANSGCRRYWSRKETECAYCGCTEHTTLRRDCAHILEVKAGRGRSLSEAVMNRMIGR